ncbi:unnamed protein product [Ectocarpus sp. 4 AP-2014]
MAQPSQEHPGALREDGHATAEREARILTWNINGLRKVAASHGGVKQLLDQFNADIVCFQEIKITRAGLVEHELARAQGYHGFFNHCKLPRKVSYSGVATFVRSESGLKTLASTTSLGDSAFFGSPGSFVGERRLSPDRLAALDSEGRVLVTDHGHFVLFNVYAPCISSSSDDEKEKTEDRRAFKRDFLATLEARILEIRSRGRGVVLVGDLNACASQLDHGFTMTDSEFYASNWSKWIRGMLGLGSPEPPRLVDCFRRLHPDRKSAFTCWNTQTGARDNNYGTRIDYIVAGTDFADRALRACDIMPDFLGSDHCPVRARFAFPLAVGLADNAPGESEGVEIAAGRSASEWPEHPPECSCFYPELTAKQEKLAKYFVAGGKNEGSAMGTEGKGADDRLIGDRNGAGESGVTQPAAGGGRGVAAFMRALPGTGVTGKDGASVAGSLMMRGKKVGSAGHTSSTSSSGGGSSTARRPGSGGFRQSKLAFGSAANDRVSTSAGAASREAPVGGSGAVSGTRRRAEGTVPLRTCSERAGGGGGAQTSQAMQPPRSMVHASDGGHDTAGAGGGSGSASTSGSSRISNPGGEGGVETGSSEGPNGGGNRRDSAEAWKAIFGRKKSAPTCEHGEPSIQRTVLKAGPNHNRRFYTCARSAGNWPTDRNARCTFFQWRRDGVRGYKDKPPRAEGGTNSSKKRRT